jgi:hypothetical protein
LSPEELAVKIVYKRFLNLVRKLQIIYKNYSRGYVKYTTPMAITFKLLLVKPQYAQKEKNTKDLSSLNRSFTAKGKK